MGSGPSSFPKGGVSKYEEHEVLGPISIGYGCLITRLYLAYIANMSYGCFYVKFGV